MLAVSHFGGTEECSSADDLKALLGMRFENDSNEFWLNHENASYPCMSMMVVGGYACLHYFPDDTSTGFVSSGIENGLDPDGITVFYTNTSSEEIEVFNDLVVDAQAGVEALIGFFDTPTMPDSIEWLEL
ncbi:MAG: hypothetical protein FWH40_05020 [Coriobacteriia bacterium]|nr:hypothetical protein [Coriobacteriia bacterium]